MPILDDSKEQLSFCTEYVRIMHKLLRSETPNEAWTNLRALQELEEYADKQDYTIFIKADLLKRDEKQRRDTP